MAKETLIESREHPFLLTIAEQLGQKDHPTDLIVDPEAALPDEVSDSFDRVFAELEKRALSVRNMDHLLEIAKPFVTTWTNHNAAVYNRERYPARIKEQARHTTPLRDVEITGEDLRNMETALKELPKGTPHDIYKMYVLAGSGSEEHWFEMYFTPEGVKLAQTVAIMMRASFEKPEGAKIDGRYFAMPEYQEVTGSSEPIELIHMGSDEKANIFVGGTTYPGEVYKPICKMLNAWVYLHGGVEIHGAGVLVEYPDPETKKQRRKMVVISGLSLHGKTTLSVADLSDEQKGLLADNLGIDVKDLQVKTSILHDDYVFVKPTDEGIEIGVYAPNGIFPAMFREEPDCRIAENSGTILFNTHIEQDDTPNFKVPFEIWKWKGEPPPLIRIANPQAVEKQEREGTTLYLKEPITLKGKQIRELRLTTDPEALSKLGLASVAVWVKDPSRGINGEVHTGSRPGAIFNWDNVSSLHLITEADRQIVIKQEDLVAPPYTTNLRAAAPLKGSFPLDIVEGGVVTDITDFVFITLTRDPAAPSAIKWQTDTDALLYFAGLVVAPTDATVKRREGLTLSYACSEFDVAQRGRLLARMQELFNYMRGIRIDVSSYTMNTGIPEPPESLAVRDAIIMENGEWLCHEGLGTLYIVGIGVPGISPYVPWQKDPETDWVKVWEDMRERRGAHFAEVHVDPKKAGLGEPKALI